MNMNIVWFKRDLRVVDHEALAMASKRGPVLPLYIFEPMLWRQPDMSRRHYQFLKACLGELSASLEAIGQKLIIKRGTHAGIANCIHSHLEVEWVTQHSSGEPFFANSMLAPCHVGRSGRQQPDCTKEIKFPSNI